MHYVQSINFEAGEIFRQLPEGATIDEWDKADENPYKFEESILMQFTGILDCDGSKIWEGDIMRYGESEADYDYLEVVFLEGIFGTPDKPVYALAEAIDRKDRTKHTDKVVGNIHQHAHLLELVPTDRD